MRLVSVLALGACLIAGAAHAQPRWTPRIAFTFDDLPAHSTLPPGETRVQVGRRIIAALKAAGLPPVYGFVNGVQTEREPASTPVLADWRAAGFPLGNHTWSHLGLSRVHLAAWEADVVKNEPLLERYMKGADWRWLRYPFLDEGGSVEETAAARAFLGRRGYRVAQVSMSFGDYAFNEPYARCMAKGDTATVAKMERAYLDDARLELHRSHAYSQALFGRDIPYVLLMHLGAFDARMLPRLLEFYRSQGARFVTLPEAERDPFYKPAVDLKSNAPDTLEGLAEARGVKVDAPGADLAWLDKACT